MEVNNTNFQLKTVILSYCRMQSEKLNYKYMDGYVDPESCATYLYPVICFLTESEFLYYYSRNNSQGSDILFEYEENKDLSLFKPIMVTPTAALKSISFSMIAPFFYFWLKMLVERYFDKLELIYIHFPKEHIFKN